MMRANEWRRQPKTQNYLLADPHLRRNSVLSSRWCVLTNDGANPKRKTQNPKRKTQNHLLRPPQFSAWSARKVFYEVKASRNLPWVDLLEQQFGKSLGRARRTHDLCRERLRRRIEEHATFLNSRQ